MASNSVEILISADDQASAKFAQVEKSMEKTSKAFKETGGKAKASTELVGTLANTLGASGLGSFAGELAQVTERLSAFSEMADQGGAGAFALKAGVLAAAGAISFKLGNAIGDVIFQTEKMNEAFEKSAEVSQELGSRIAEIQGSRFSETLESIREISDLEERRKAANEELNRILNEGAAIQGRIDKLNLQLGGRTGTIMGNIASISGEYAKTTEIMQDQLATLEQQKEQLAGQQQLVATIAAGEIDRLAAIAEAEKAEAERQQKSSEYVSSLQDELELLNATEQERNEIIARRNTANEDDYQAAVDLLEKKREINEEEKRRAELERQAQQAENERIRELERSEKERERTIEKIAKAQEDADKEEADRQKRLRAQTSLSASEGRLLSRGSNSENFIGARGDTSQKQVEKLSEISKLQAELKKILEKIAENTKGGDGLDVTIVGSATV